LGEPIIFFFPIPPILDFPKFPHLVVNLPSMVVRGGERGEVGGGSISTLFSS
jgi:hypothetical protein